MATNPMQRRTRNAFLIGAIIGLVIAAFVGFILMNKITQLNKQKKALEVLQRKFYVLSADVKSGEEITSDLYEYQTVQTKMNQQNNFNPADAVDENGNPKKMFAKVSLPAGTILTEDLLYAEGEQTKSDLRVQEYNMLSLPSQLQEGDYIDVRLRVPSGENYIVLTKKRVIKTNEDTIWLQLDESEMLLLDNAIVESYIMEGSKLYATTYAEAGMQTASVSTYVPSEEVGQMMLANPNITEEAKREISNRIANLIRNRNKINSILGEFSNSATSSITSATNDEVTKTKEARSEYLTELDGAY